MRMLAIETATEACSVALFDGGRLLDHRHEVLGRGHAERLVPMIASLPDKGRAKQVRVSLGPGSFTGVRIGLAVARALGIVWNAEVIGYPTLALLAHSIDMHRDLSEGEDRGAMLVCMNGGHGEWYLQSFGANRLPEGSCRSMPADLAVQAFDEDLVAGSRAREFVSLRGSGEAVPLLPDARGVASLAPEVLTDRLTPIYGREPDAKRPGQ